ncbi:putative F-box protein At3g16210 [Medicago truncatula]|uniref:F-box protein interaction domain protein n=1 Tax=Medicago truncatula TaxID=3880 RepID=G7LFI2_MEDTR|nr:putative F-box protein At3g16210 [Medicago truncatula]AET03161.1 F-box protein interaction domain protein [Medicago truncatula]
MASSDDKVSNHIPDDVAFFILSKLSLKALKRFTCVRKSWVHLFENPNFISMFCNNFILKDHSFYDDTCLLLKQTVPGHYYHCALYLLSGENFENKVILNWPPPFQADDIDMDILGSGINGTLCLHRYHRTIVLWNPTIGEFKVIPPSPIDSQLHDPTSVTLHGFGYDSVRDDYKVIRHAEFHQRNAFAGSLIVVPLERRQVWEMYSLRSESWRKLNVDMLPCNRRNAGAEVYMDGVCHWWGYAYDGPCLVSFNLSSEVILTTPIPLDMDESFEWMERHLAVLNMSIAIISHHANKNYFHISVLGELGVKESWIKLFVVGPLPCVHRPVGVGKKGDIFFIKEDSEVICLNLSNGMIKEIGVKEDLFRCQIVIYKPNFLPIGRLNN